MSTKRLRKKEPVILLNFDEDEVNAHSIKVDGKLVLKSKRGKRLNETESEKEVNKCKVAINDNLARKLVDKSHPLASFHIKDGVKFNSKKNPTHKIIYIECTEHKCSMPVRYKLSDHKLGSPLRMKWTVKCSKCIELINQHISQEVEKMTGDVPECVDPIPPTPNITPNPTFSAAPANSINQRAISVSEQKVDTALQSLSEAVGEFMAIVKTKVMATHNP
jgi:hypothetical protein